MKKQLNHTYFVIALIIAMGAFFQTCEQFRINADCGGDDPVENLEWLGDMIIEYDTFQQRWSTISRAEYEGDDYFILGYCHPAITYVPIYLNCDGDTIDLRANNPSVDQEIFGNEDWSWVWCGTSCDCGE